MSDSALTDLVISRVTAFALKGRSVPRPTKVTRTRWSQDPYSLGAYSYWSVGNNPGKCK